MTSPMEWPSDLRPTEMTFYVQTVTAQTQSSLSGVIQAKARPGARWVATITVQAITPQLQWLEALITKQQSGAVEVLLPFFGHQAGRFSGHLSFDDYAAEIGELGFDDDTRFSDGRGFVEGAGTPTVIDGCGDRMIVTGCYPGVSPWLEALLQTSPGRLHWVVNSSIADENGTAALGIFPNLRETPNINLRETKNPTVLMRLTSGEALSSPTTAPAQVAHQLTFEESLS
ncbi:putative Extracellular solute-binding protein family 3 [Azospirillaceae bacterium]